MYFPAQVKKRTAISANALAVIYQIRMSFNSNFRNESKLEDGSFMIHPSRKGRSFQVDGP